MRAGVANPGLMLPSMGDRMRKGLAKGVRLCQPLNLGLPVGGVCPRIGEPLCFLDARGDARRTGERWSLSVRFPMVRRDTEQTSGFAV